MAFMAPAPLPRWALADCRDLLGAAATASGDERAGELSAVELTEALGELHTYSMVGLDTDALSVHRLVQAVQQDSLSEVEQREWVERAVVLVRREFPEADHSNWQRCEALLPHALVCSEHAGAVDLISREAGLLPGLAGDFLIMRGQISAARAPLEQSVATLERLSASDPGNAGWQRDLSVSHNRIGDVRRAQGDLPGALQAYEASLEIREGLAASDPGNAGWQRDLSVSHNKIGDVRVAQGDLAGALQAYEASHGIFEGLAASDPGNAGWQYDLGISHERIGTVRQAQGNLDGALQAFEARHAIISRLAAADPGNAQWQRDLSVSHYKLAHIANEAGDAVRERRHLLACRETLRGMKARGMHLDPQSAAVLEELEGLGG